MTTSQNYAYLRNPKLPQQYFCLHHYLFFNDFIIHEHGFGQSLRDWVASRPGPQRASHIGRGPYLIIFDPREYDTKTRLEPSFLTRWSECETDRRNPSYDSFLWWTWQIRIWSICDHVWIIKIANAPYMTWYGHVSAHMQGVGVGRGISAHRRISNMQSWYVTHIV